MDLITVSKAGASGFRIGVRKHEVPCDMSEKEGGADAGFNPVELLAGSLGGCVALMVQRYCDRHGFKDGEIGVSMTLELADNPKRVNRFFIDLEIPKDVPEEKKEALLRMARACPVHNTLKQSPEVDIEIV